MIDLNELQKKIYENKVKKGFNLTNISQEFCYIYGEVGEAFDAFIKKKDKEELGLELADVAIYLLGLSEILDISLEEMIEKKVKINENRVYVNGVKVTKEDKK